MKGGLSVAGGIALVLLGLSGNATAQFSDSGGGASSDGGGGGSAACADCVVEIKGIKFNVQQVRQAEDGGGLTLVMTMTYEGSDARQLAFVQPQAELIDDNGNVFLATDTAGIRVCGFYAPWDEEPRNCAARSREDLVELNPSLAKTVSIFFQPKEGRPNSEAADFANLSARFIVAVGPEWEVMDISLPGIPMSGE